MYNSSSITESLEIICRNNVTCNDTLSYNFPQIWINLLRIAIFTHLPFTLCSMLEHSNGILCLKGRRSVLCILFQTMMTIFDFFFFIYAHFFLYIYNLQHFKPIIVNFNQINFVINTRIPLWLRWIYEFDFWCTS